MICCFISDIKPLSIQAKGINAYKERLIENFKEYKKIGEKNSKQKIPIFNNESIYSKIIYIHSKKTTIDVDNMSKPLVDAFIGTIYSDDSIIDHRISSKILLKDFQTIEISMDNIPDEDAEKLNELLEKGSEHILYFEVSNFSGNMINIRRE